MKKVLAFLLTAIMAVTAFTVAAENPSPEKSSGVIVSVSGEDADGSSLKLAVEPTKIEQSTYNQALDNLKKEAGDDSLKIVDQKRLVLKEGKEPKFPLTVDLIVPGVKPTSKVFVLFKADENQAEGLSDATADGEVIGLSVPVNFSRVINLAETAADVQKLDAKAGDGKVTVTFNALGEFVLVTDAQTVADVTAASEAGSNTTTESNTATEGNTSTESNASTEETKSPQTADNAASVVVAMLAVSVLAAVISVKKIRTAK